MILSEIARVENVDYLCLRQRLLGGGYSLEECVKHYQERGLKWKDR